MTWKEYKKHLWYMSNNWDVMNHSMWDEHNKLYNKYICYYLIIAQVLFIIWLILIIVK